MTSHAGRICPNCTRLRIPYDPRSSDWCSTCTTNELAAGSVEDLDPPGHPAKRPFSHMRRPKTPRYLRAEKPRSDTFPGTDEENPDQAEHHPHTT